MLDVRPTAYIVPLGEQVLDDLTPVIQVTSTGDEDARVTGLVRIYRQSTDQLLYTSELAVTIITHHTVVNIAALSAWSPPAPADDDYFILVDTLAQGIAPDPPMRATLGAFRFDIKPGPMGPAPAAHHATHEDGGMDEVNVTGLSGELADDQPALAHDIASARHTSSSTPGQILQANANGLPIDATNTDTQVAGAVSHTGATSDPHGSTLTQTVAVKTPKIYPPADSTSAVQILKADGTTSIFNVDSQNARVGIGTTVPGAKLDVNGTTYTTRLGVGSGFNAALGTTPGHQMEIFATGTNAPLVMAGGSAEMEMWKDATPSKAVSYGMAVPGSAATDDLIFSTYNGSSWSERLRVLSSNGNVGIGTSPTAKLDVNSDIIRLRTAKTPASAGAAGNAGDICWDADYIYVCVATNTWKRAAIGTW